MADPETERKSTGGRRWGAIEKFPFVEWPIAVRAAIKRIGPAAKLGVRIATNHFTSDPEFIRDPDESEWFLKQNTSLAREVAQIDASAKEAVQEVFPALVVQLREVIRLRQ